VCSNAATNGYSVRKRITKRQGDVGDVVFPCGTTIGPDRDTLSIYYGAADTCIGLATASISELLAWLDRHSSPRSASSPDRRRADRQQGISETPPPSNS